MDSLHFQLLGWSSTWSGLVLLQLREKGWSSNYDPVRILSKVFKPLLCPLEQQHLQLFTCAPKEALQQQVAIVASLRWMTKWQWQWPQKDLMSKPNWMQHSQSYLVQDTHIPSFDSGASKLNQRFLACRQHLNSSSLSTCSWCWKCHCPSCSMYRFFVLDQKMIASTTKNHYNHPSQWLQPRHFDSRKNQHRPWAWAPGHLTAFSFSRSSHSHLRSRAVVSWNFINANQHLSDIAIAAQKDEWSLSSGVLRADSWKTELQFTLNKQPTNKAAQVLCSTNALLHGCFAAQVLCCTTLLLNNCFAAQLLCSTGSLALNMSDVLCSKVHNLTEQH